MKIQNNEMVATLAALLNAAGIMTFNLLIRHPVLDTGSSDLEIMGGRGLD